MDNIDWKNKDLDFSEAHNTNFIFLKNDSDDKDDQWKAFNLNDLSQDNLSLFVLTI